jgi:hypothetical protein
MLDSGEGHRVVNADRTRSGRLPTPLLQPLRQVAQSIFNSLIFKDIFGVLRAVMAASPAVTNPTSPRLSV